MPADPVSSLVMLIDPELGGDLVVLDTIRAAVHRTDTVETGHPQAIALPSGDQ